MRRKNEIFLFEGEISREKYHSTNPIARRLVEDFMTSLLSLVEQSGSSRFLEIGCGEGQICGLLAKNGYEVKGIDISADAIAVAKREAKRHSLDIEFVQGDLFKLKLDAGSESRQAVICCEVLEHVDDPEEALKRVVSMAESRVVLSVPREPLWRILNMVRGKYLSDLGNTPGHIQHWTKSGFIKLVSRHAKVLAVRTPTPWTMLLCEPLRKTSKSDQ